ncbi:MAG: MjaI family restriction endonuclease [Deltaproteobacteria bacterium]|nr:MjaI family restriction endonuclease [Deltaproteobacteria bacterium]
MAFKKFAKDFGSKEIILNYGNRRWGLTKTNKVGEVMAMIRQCQPKTFQEWEDWYFKNAFTNTKQTIKITEEILTELGQRLHEKITEIVAPQLREALATLTQQDCIDYIYQLTIHRTFDGYLAEKSVVHDNLAKEFPDVVFEETNPDLDHAGDIDFIGKVGNKAFGLQIKPITAHASLGDFSVTARMEQSFRDFEEQFGGKVFIVFSVEDKIKNIEVIAEIKKEIERLRK